MRNLKLALACLLLASPTARAQRPNIVVFLVDDMGWQETSVEFHSERTALNERYHTGRTSISATLFCRSLGV